MKCVAFEKANDETLANALKEANSLNASLKISNESLQQTCISLKKENKDLEVRFGALEKSTSSSSEASCSSNVSTNVIDACAYDKSLALENNELREMVMKSKKTLERNYRGEASLKLILSPTYHFINK